MHGDNSVDVQGEPAPEVQVPLGEAMPGLRAVARGVPQVSAVPGVFPEHGQSGPDPGREESELVNRGSGHRAGGVHEAEGPRGAGSRVPPRLNEDAEDVERPDC